MAGYCERPDRARPEAPRPGSLLRSQPIRLSSRKGGSQSWPPPQHLEVLRGIWLGRKRTETVGRSRRRSGSPARLPDIVEAFILGEEVLLGGGLPLPPRKGYFDGGEAPVRPPRHLCRCLGVLAEVARAWFCGRFRHHPHPALLGGQSGRASEAVVHVREIRGEASGQVPRQGDLDRGGWLAERGPDARRRAALAVKSGARLERRRRGGQGGGLEDQSHRGVRPAVEAAAGGNGRRLLGPVRATAPSSRNSVSASRCPIAGMAVVAGLGVFAAFLVFLSAWRARSARRGHDVARAIWRPQASRSPPGSCSGSPPSRLTWKASSRATGCGPSAVRARARRPMAAAFALAHGDGIASLALALDTAIGAARLVAVVLTAAVRGHRGRRLHVALGLVFDPRYKDFPSLRSQSRHGAGDLAFADRAPLPRRNGGDRRRSRAFGLRAVHHRQRGDRQLAGAPGSPRLLGLLAPTLLPGARRARLRTRSVTASADSRVL